MVVKSFLQKNVYMYKRIELIMFKTEIVLSCRHTPIFFLKKSIIKFHSIFLCNVHLMDNYQDLYNIFITTLTQGH